MLSALRAVRNALGDGGGGKVDAAVVVYNERSRHREQRCSRVRLYLPNCCERSQSAICVFVGLRKYIQIDRFEFRFVIRLLVLAFGSIVILFCLFMFSFSLKRPFHSV